MAKIVDDCIIPIAVRQILHLFQHQMVRCPRNSTSDPKLTDHKGVSFSHCHLRTGIAHLRCGSNVRCSHRRPCYRWSWICRYLLRSACDSCVHGPARQASHLHRFNRSYVRYCLCCWTSNGWCFHRQSLVEVVYVFPCPMSGSKSVTDRCQQAFTSTYQSVL